MTFLSQAGRKIAEMLESKTQAERSTVNGAPVRLKSELHSHLAHAIGGGRGQGIEKEDDRKKLGD